MCLNVLMYVMKECCVGMQRNANVFPCTYRVQYMGYECGVLRIKGVVVNAYRVLRILRIANRGV